MSNKKKILSGIYSYTVLMIVIAGVILINIISSFVYKRFDMTEDQRFSLAPSTINFLEKADNFKSRLNIKIYLEGNLPAELSRFRNAIEDKLIEFKQHAGDRIEYQFINPSPENATEEENRELHDILWDKGRGILPMDVVYMKDGSQSKIRLWPGALIEYGGSTVNTVQLLPGSRSGQPMHLNDLSRTIHNAINNLEYMLVSSLRRATQEVKPRIGFLQGHGELTFAETQRVRALLTPYYAVNDVTLNDSIHALERFDGLVIARPRKKFSDKDLYLIDQFLMNGGRLMCFIDKLFLPEDTLDAYGKTNTVRYDLGIDNLLFDYGLKINDNYVIDARCVPKRVPMADKAMLPWFFHVVATPTSHPIARNVEPVDLKYTSEVQFVNQNESVALTPILTSSTNATVTGLAPLVSLGMPLNYGKNPELVPDPDNENNKKCIAGLAEGMFTSHFKNRLVEEFANNPDIGMKKESVKEGKVFVIGNGRMLANQYDSMPEKMGDGFMYRPKAFNDLIYDEELAQMGMQHMFGNQEFMQNLADYMMGDNSVLDIRSRQIEQHEIDNEKVKESANYYRILNLNLPLLLILILGIGLHYIRKRKFAH